jgi:proteasome lid subunit RPN8/RPN11
MIRVSAPIVEDTLHFLRHDGTSGREGVVLWLGRRFGEACAVTSVVRPEQEAAEDYFRIPERSMREVMSLLRTTNQLIVAQVHSHPGAAFHSEADDRWAIIRHIGALSVVVPNFARGMDFRTFTHWAAFYVHRDSGEWARVQPGTIIEVTT